MTTHIAALLPILRRAALWRVHAIREKIREVQSSGVADHIRCLHELGFVLPPLERMQNYARLKFLHDCILRFAPGKGVALEVGCYKCSAMVFIAKACAKKQVQHIYAMDLFTGTPSWNLSVDYFEDAQQKLARYGLRDQVTLIRAHSLQYPWKDPIAVLHVDADHAYEAVWQDIQKYTAFLVEGGIVVFDDYDTDHPGVMKAVHRLLAVDGHYEVAAANYQGHEFGSLCLRRLIG
jgi:methyltransferase family protein